MRWLIPFLICSPVAVHGGEWHVDKKAEGNQVEFTSKVVAFTFTGTTDKIDGFIYWEGDSLFAAKDQLHFEVDLASFDTGIGKRDRDMRQVLDTDKWPKAVYKGEIAEHVCGRFYRGRLSRQNQGDFVVARSGSRRRSARYRSGGRGALQGRGGFHY